MILYDEYEISMERDEFGQKINTLCSALRKYILGLNSKKRIHDLFTVVLTTFVTEQPYDISITCTYNYLRI